MIKFKSMTLRNFMSFGNDDQVFKMGGNGISLISGTNLDNLTNGESSNGVGKSTLLNAITFCLFNKPVTNISTLDRLINYKNKKNMVVSIILEKDGYYYNIIRARKAKTGAAGNYIEIYKNTEEVFEDEHLITEASDPNKQIENILGITYELFVRIVLFTADRNSFFDLPERATSKGKASQSSMIETLFGITDLTEKADRLKPTIKDDKDHLTLLLKEQEIKNQEFARHQIQLSNALARVTSWNQKNKADIQLAKDEIDTLQHIDVNEQKKLFDELDIINNTISELDKTLIFNVNELKPIIKIIKTTSEQLSHLKQGNCPFCKQTYTDQSITEELSNLLEEQNRKTNELQKIIDSIELSLNESNAIRNNIKKLITVKNKDELSLIDKKISDFTKVIEMLEQQQNPHIEAVQELRELKLEKFDDVEIIKLEKIIKHKDILYKLLTKKDSFIRKALLNRNLPFLNNRLSTYIYGLGLPHTIEFMHDLSVSITTHGETIDFGNLSRGQQSRVNLSLALAFRDVLQSLHTPINFCIFDEVLDVGLDSVGVQLAIKILKEKTAKEHTSINIISHRDEVTSLFDKQIRIFMEDGFTTIADH